MNYTKHAYKSRFTVGSIRSTSKHALEELTIETRAIQICFQQYCHTIELNTGITMYCSEYGQFYTVLK